MAAQQVHTILLKLVIAVDQAEAVVVTSVVQVVLEIHLQHLHHKVTQEVMVALAVLVMLMAEVEVVQEHQVLMLQGNMLEMVALA